ncbi:adenylate kinase [Dictyobacter alpinus]|uniref:Adenylate kinase n=1 Tax=Dictyobacter alpinus TaxID=2014873 RepID=A0A402B4B0_9CHLR|nr:adenylate kinase [Dictyobacter alpinus]GCE26170.1 adenylate kinase [Dictyobacter alpinus]
MNIILLGAQGSGKGTQAKRLAQTLGMHHVSSGDLFRKASEAGTEVGKKAQSYFDRGELVPDDLTVAMVLEHISQEKYVRDGVLLDGFPRTIAQAQALDQGLLRVGRFIDCSLYLEVPREELLHRLSGRYICQANQHVYNIDTNPPKVPGICDLDGSELYQRADDQGSAIQKRLDIFFNETIRLLDYYEQQHKLKTVNGNHNIEQVSKDLIHAVKACK